MNYENAARPLNRRAAYIELLAAEWRRQDLGEAVAWSRPYSTSITLFEY